MASLDITLWSRGEREGVEEEKKGIEETGKNVLSYKRIASPHYLWFNIQQICQKQKETNKQNYQTNKQIEKNTTPKLRIEIKIILKLIVVSSSNQTN